jgi:hypothetical protein
MVWLVWLMWLVLQRTLRAIAVAVAIVSSGTSSANSELIVRNWAGSTDGMETWLDPTHICWS